MQRSRPCKVMAEVLQAERPASAKIPRQETGETNCDGYEWQRAGKEVGKVAQIIQNSSRTSGFYSSRRGKLWRAQTGRMT